MNSKTHLFLLITAFFALSVTVNAQIPENKISVIPESAIITDSLKNELEKSPFTLKSLKQGVVYSVTSKGYEPMFFKMKTEKKPIPFPENLSSCSPCLMELNGSAFEEGVEKTSTLRLRKKVADRRQTIMLGVMTSQIKISDETVIAQINGRKLKYNNDNIHLTMGYAQNLTHPIINGLENNFIDAYDVDENKKETTRLYKAKIFVKPVITKLEYRLEGRLLRDYSGPAAIECEWRFFYTTDTTKSLGSITTKTSLYRTGGDYDLPVHLLVYEAAKDLVNTDTLFSYLDKMERKYLAGALSAPTSVSKTPEVRFANQKEMLRHFSSAVVTIENEDGFGSGIVIDPSGVILTNYHVVESDTSTLKVRISSSEELVPAHVKVLNSDYDLALIEVSAGKLTAVSLEEKDSLEVGDAVFAIGTPLDRALGQSVTKGIVSGFRRLNGVNFIQTDVSINSGNSGGALVSETGKLMGIATMKAAGKGIEGLGFCIPASTIITALGLKQK